MLYGRQREIILPFRMIDLTLIIVIVVTNIIFLCQQRRRSLRDACRIRNCVRILIALGNITVALYPMLIHAIDFLVVWLFIDKCEVVRIAYNYQLHFWPFVLSMAFILLALDLVARCRPNSPAVRALNRSTPLNLMSSFVPWLAGLIIAVPISFSNILWEHLCNYDSLGQVRTTVVACVVTPVSVALLICFVIVCFLARYNSSVQGSAATAAAPAAASHSQTATAPMMETNPERPSLELEEERVPLRPPMTSESRPDVPSSKSKSGFPSLEAPRFSNTIQRENTPPPSSHHQSLACAEKARDEASQELCASSSYSYHPTTAATPTTTEAAVDANSEFIFQKDKQMLMLSCAILFLSVMPFACHVLASIAGLTGSWGSNGEIKLIIVETMYLMFVLHLFLVPCVWLPYGTL